MRFAGKVVVVTGGCSGIGLETATAFGREGARVALVDRDTEMGQAALQGLQAAGYTALLAPTDVSKPEDVSAMANTVAQQWGRLDVLVNNAGIYRQGSAVNTSEEDWEQVLAVNLTGAFLCTKHAVPIMCRNGGGVIVNVASEAGLVGIRNQVAYNVSKAAVKVFTEATAHELRQDPDRQVTAHLLIPGFVFTALTALFSL